MTDQNALDRELLRFTFCSIIIAAFLAGVAAGSDLRTLINPGNTQLALVVLGLSAGFAFAYVLSVAAHLKYQSRGKIDRFPVPISAGKFFYDASINIFGFYFIVLAAQWITAHLFHSHAVWSVLLVVVFGSGIIYLLALPVWLLAMQTISKIYDARGRN